MDVVPKKTVRFTALVQSSGRPEQATLWTAPEQTPYFWKAVQQRRVLTVVQHNVGTKKDYGIVGFFQEPQATFLIFPKRIPYPDETKIIGIKYDQLEDAPISGPVYKGPLKRAPGVKMQEKPAKTSAPEPEKEPEEAPPPPPVKRLFRATLEITAKQTVPLEIEAISREEANRLIKERAADAKLDLAQAIERRKLSKVTMVK